MNKVLTNITGGYPRVIDYLGFMDESIREAFQGILSCYGLDDDESFIISGVEPEDMGAQWAWNDGYISINGEVLKVDAGTCPIGTPVTGNVYGWEIVETYDTSGNFQFFDLTTHDVYQIRKAKIGYFPEPAGGYTPAYAPTMFSLMESKLAALFPSNLYNAVTFNGNWTNGSVNIGALKGRNNTIYIKGNTNHPSTATDGLLFTLPAGFRPLYQLIRPVVIGGGTQDVAYVKIETDGKVSLMGSSTATDVYFDGLSFKL